MKKEAKEEIDVNYAGNKYIQLINAETKATEIIWELNQDNDSNLVRFSIRLKWDDYIDIEDHPLNVSYKFIKLNDSLFRGFFGKLPTYNNTRTTWWATVNNNR